MLNEVKKTATRSRKCRSEAVGQDRRCKSMRYSDLCSLANDMDENL